MSKIVRDTHVTGMKGVNLFEQYCLQHKPVIVFRETLKSDFGIDGEIEMTSVNEEKKVEPTGEILKIQIKTDGTGSSYIRNKNDSQFDYYASNDDLEYWSKYKNHGLEVILVIIDESAETIYCKKVFDYDIVSAKATLKKKKNIPITFHVDENKLIFGKHDFRERFSASFRTRVNYSVKETLVSNLLRVKNVPKILFVYDSKFNSNKAIAEFIKKDDAPLKFSDCPFYTAYGGKVYTFSQLGKEFSAFTDHILENKNYKTIGHDEILENRPIRNHYTELLNQYFQYNLRKKGMHYNRKYKRYYFAFNPEKDVLPLTVEAVTRVRKEKIDKKVVTWHEYGTRYKFYRHLGFEISYHFIESELYISLAHKYFFTEDGKKTLAPKEITKFTNFLTARDYNDKYYDWLRFWWTYLTKDNENWEVFDYNKVTIKINPFFYEEVEFGIPLENKIEKPKLRKHFKPVKSTNTLFGYEN